MSDMRDKIGTSGTGGATRDAVDARKFFAAHQENWREEFMRHVRPRVRELLDRRIDVPADAAGADPRGQIPRPITWAEYSALFAEEYVSRDGRGFDVRQCGLNSYERRLIHERLDDDALARFLSESILVQIAPRLHQYELARSYDDAVIREFFPLLLDRLRDSAARERTRTPESRPADDAPAAPRGHLQKDRNRDWTATAEVANAVPVTLSPDETVFQPNGRDRERGAEQHPDWCRNCGKHIRYHVGGKEYRCYQRVSFQQDSEGPGARRAIEVLGLEAAELRSSLLKARQEAENLKSDLSCWKSSCEAVRADGLRLSKDLAAARASNKFLNEEGQRLDKVVKDNAAVRKLLDQEIEKSRTAAAAARAEVISLRGQLHDVEKRRQGHKDAAEFFQQQIKDDRAAFESLRQQVSAARTGAYAAETSARELGARLTNARTQLGLAANIARYLYAALHEIADDGAPCPRGHRIDADRALSRVGSPETWALSEAQPGVPLPPSPRCRTAPPTAVTATPAATAEGSKPAAAPGSIRAAVDRLDAVWRSAPLRVLKDEAGAGSWRRLSSAFKAVEMTREWEIVDGRAVLLPPGSRPLQRGAVGCNAAPLTPDTLSAQLTAESRLRAGATPPPAPSVEARHTVPTPPAERKRFDDNYGDGDCDGCSRPILHHDLISGVYYCRPTPADGRKRFEANRQHPNTPPFAAVCVNCGRPYLNHDHSGNGNHFCRPGSGS